MKNKYEQMFDEYLDLTEFSLIKYGSQWGLIDNQGANLGDIESDRFDSASDIFDRMYIYINDYFIRDIEDLLREKQIEVTWGYEFEEYLKYAKPLLPDAKWDFDVLDMICYHANEIDLNNCIYEEGDDLDETN